LGGCLRDHSGRHRHGAERAHSELSFVHEGLGDRALESDRLGRHAGQSARHEVPAKSNGRHLAERFRDPADRSGD